MAIAETRNVLHMVGSFWLPSHPDERRRGELTISDTHEITLEISGIFGDPYNIFGGLVSSATILQAEGGEPNTDRIVGELEDGQPITLYGCLPLPRSFSFRPGPPKSVFRANLAFVGVAYLGNEAPKSTELSVAIEGLNEWLSVSAFQVKRDNASNSGTITYRGPDDVVVSLSDGEELRFTCNLTFPNLSAFRPVEVHVSPNPPKI